MTAEPKENVCASCGVARKRVAVEVPHFPPGSETTKDCRHTETITVCPKCKA